MDSSDSISGSPATGCPTPLPLYPPSSSLMPIRPEARRAYQAGDQGSSGNNERGSLMRKKSDTSSDNKTLLLQQAANYASLAIQQQQQQQQQQQPRMRVDSGTDLTQASLVAPAAAAAAATIAPLGAAVRRISRGPFRTLSKRRKDAPLMTLHSVNMTSQERSEGDGEDAPRLSISSADSSEVKTPDSASYIDIQGGGNGEGEKGKEETAGRILGKVEKLLISQHQRPSAAPVTIPPAVKYAIGSVEDTSAARQRLVGQQLMDAHQHNSREGDDVETGAKSGEANDQSAPFLAVTTQSRASTIRAKRPDGLLRLASTRTDDTARPSPPSTSPVPSSAGPTPAATADSAFGKARDPMGDAVATKSAHDLLSSSQIDSSDELAKQISQAFNKGMHTSNYYDDDFAKEPSMSRDSIASPDSWRSLLPEHDPYFISSEALSSSTSSRAASFAGPINAQYQLSLQGHASADGLTSDSQAMAVSLSDKEGRRLSSDSLQSSFSLAGPTAASIYASSNASGSLYDMDGTFNTGGSRAAFAPLQYHYNQSSKSLASPLLQHAKEHDLYRSNSIDETREGKADNMAGDDGAAAQQAAYRRHASFSAFDSPSSSKIGTGYVINPVSPTTYASFIHPDHHDRSRVYNSRPQQSDLVAAASSPERQAVSIMPLKYSSLSGVMSPSSPASSSAMGNEGDRQSWPSSRNSMQGWQSDVANKASPRSFVQVLDPYSVNEKLTEAVPPTTMSPVLGALETIPSVLSMSTSTTESDVPGMPADHRLLTTTTLTTLASTTTTLIASTITPSEPRSRSMQPAAHRAAASQLTPPMEQQQQHTQPKAAALDVSPFSPASMPFLDTRPAPASTELKVETQDTHYTLRTNLPGFDIDGITLSIKHHRQLVIVADSWDESTGGHFERRVTFGIDANLRATRAIFDGSLLKITVPRVL